jgi:hypothetical protein
LTTEQKQEKIDSMQRYSSATHEVFSYLHSMDDVFFPLADMPVYAQGALLYLSGRDFLTRKGPTEVHQGRKIRQVREATQMTEAMEDIRAERSTVVQDKTDNTTVTSNQPTIREQHRRENHIELNTPQKLEYIAEIIEKILANPEITLNFFMNPVNTALQINSISVQGLDLETHHFDRNEISPNTALTALFAYLDRENIEPKFKNQAGKVLGKDFRQAWEDAGADARGSIIPLNQEVSLVLKPRMNQNKELVGFALGIRITPTEEMKKQKQQIETETPITLRTIELLKDPSKLIETLGQLPADQLLVPHWIAKSPSEPRTFTTEQAKQIEKDIRGQYTQTQESLFPPISATDAQVGLIRYNTAVYEDSTKKLHIIMQPTFSEKTQETTWKIGFRASPEYMSEHAPTQPVVKVQ